MSTPTVIEISPRPEPVGQDTFISDLKARTAAALAYPARP
jgi:hypothetical protein